MSSGQNPGMKKAKDSLVSIIIPCYNNEPFVEAAINSALDQTYPHIEVVVIDDGSSDRSLEIIQSFGDLIYWETQPNKGGPAARNRGLELATGDYIKFLDADDVLMPECIERQVRLSGEIGGDRKAIVYGEAAWVDQSLHPLVSYPLRPLAPNENAISHILTACPLTTCPLHRRDYLLAVEGFDVTLLRGQEHDLHLRLVLSDVEFIYYPDVVYQYRNYEDTARVSHRALDRNDALVQYDILKRQQLLIEQKCQQPLPLAIRRAIAQRYWAFGRRVLRNGCSKEASDYFKAARDLYPADPVAGNFLYAWLVKLLNPDIAELVLDRMKVFLKEILVAYQADRKQTRSV